VSGKVSIVTAVIFTVRSGNAPTPSPPSVRCYLFSAQLLSYTRYLESKLPPLYSAGQWAYAGIMLAMVGHMLVLWSALIAALTDK